MSGRVDVAKLPVPSTCMGDVTATDSGGAFTLTFDYFKEDDDSRYQGGIAFDRVRAYRHRAESHCEVWHIDAYDTLQEVTGSEWVAELLAATSEPRRSRFEMHHFVIYFDSSGCYEVVAASWVALPERAVGEEKGS